MSRGRPGPAWLAIAAGHLAVWLGLYFAAAYVLAVLVLGREVSAAALFASFCAGVGLYLLDRVKLRDRWIDPADRLAQPGGLAFLLAHQRAVRVAALGAVLAGAVGVATLDLRNLALPLIGVGGVVIYSERRGSVARPKDVLGAKNLLPGLAIGGLAVILAWQSPGSDTAVPAPGLWVLTSSLVLLVTADAALCDLDDATVDAAHGTATLTTRFGRRWTWGFAFAAHALAGSGLVLAGVMTEHLRESTLLALANLAATLVLFAGRPGCVRDLVDLKLPAVVTVVWLLR